MAEEEQGILVRGGLGDVEVGGEEGEEVGVDCVVEELGEEVETAVAFGAGEAGGGDMRRGVQPGDGG